KNLLSLGEDRYLTTLMMKTFPKFKLKFIHDAKCKTIAPEKWSVLVSQRRRWINSTIHNLAELLFLPDMCGFCFFSMRFVVFLDLFGTLTMPCTLIYFAYLIYAAVRNIADVGYISLILIGAIYGVQAIIFILRREWQHIGWMLIYLLAYPLWSFILPIYSFWHMDDFSWGNTRVVVGDGKRKIIIEDDKPFDPESIPQRRWLEYEKELAMAGVLNAPPPNMNPRAGSSKEDDRLSLYSSQSGAPISRAESAMALNMMGHPQSMYGTPPPPPPPMPVGYDPRLSVAMGTPQMLQQQQQQQQLVAMAGAGYDGSLGRHSVASSGRMTPIDPRLSVAMGGQAYPSPQQQQLMPMQQHQSAYMGAPEGWMAPVSMYGPGTPEMRPISYLNPQYGQSQPHSIYVPAGPEMAAGSGRTTPLMYPAGAMAEMPSDDRIADAIRRILVNADLATTTKKAIRARLAQEFGVDLTAKKEYISSTIDTMLIGTKP
ncbi:hypothetical protein IWQ57_004635, partial [Coemansia nantahalensis]